MEQERDKLLRSLKEYTEIDDTRKEAIDQLNKELREQQRQVSSGILEKKGKFHFFCLFVWRSIADAKLQKKLNVGF